MVLRGLGPLVVSPRLWSVGWWSPGRMGVEDGARESARLRFLCPRRNRGLHFLQQKSCHDALSLLSMGVISSPLRFPIKYWHQYPQSIRFLHSARDMLYITFDTPNR